MAIDIPVRAPQNIFETITGNETAENSLTSNSLKNKMQALENQFYPEKTQADIDNTKATTNKLNTMTPLEAINQQNINEWYGRKAAAEIAAQNSLAQARNMGGGGQAGLGAGGKEQLFFNSQIKQAHPDWNESKIREYSDALIDGNLSQFSDGTAMPSPTGNVSQSLNRVIKYGSTTQGINQQRSAAILDNLLDKGEQLMPSVAKYAGLVGKTNQGADAFFASTGGQNPDYMKFQIFTQQIVPQLANQMLLTEGGRATDQQKKMMLRIANPTYWNSNPQMALKEYQYLLDTFKNGVSPIVSSDISTIRGGLRKNNSSSVKKSDDPLGIL